MDEPDLTMDDLPALLAALFGRHRRDPLYCTEDDTHVHTCEKCGTSWEHPRGGGPDVDTEEKHTAAHTCPKCGATQFYKTELATVGKIDYPWPRDEAEGSAPAPQKED